MITQAIGGREALHCEEKEMVVSTEYSDSLPLVGLIFQRRYSRAVVILGHPFYPLSQRVSTPVNVIHYLRRDLPSKLTCFRSPPTQGRSLYAKFFETFGEVAQWHRCLRNPGGRSVVSSRVS